MRKLNRLLLISLGMIAVLSGLVIGSKILGTFQRKIFECFVIQDLNRDTPPNAIDLNTSTVLRLQKPTPRLEQRGESPNKIYELLGMTSKSGIGTSSGLFLRNRSTQQTIQYTNLEIIGPLSWSPDSRFLAMSVWKNQTVGQSYPVEVLLSTDGTMYREFTTVGQSYTLWSDDSTYVAYSSSQTVFIIRAKDSSTQALSYPFTGSLHWIPQKHKLLYTWGQTPAGLNNLALYDLDTEAQQTVTFSPIGQTQIDYDLSPDGRVVAVYEKAQDLNQQLRLFNISGNKIYELEAKGTNFSFQSMYWGPDSQSIIFVAGIRHTLISYSLKENQTRIIIPYGVERLSNTSNKWKYLIQQRTSTLYSLYILNLENGQVQMIKDSVVYFTYWIRRTSTYYDSNKMFIISKDDTVYNVDLFYTDTGQQTRIFRNVPRSPMIYNSNNSIVIAWKSPAGGGLAKYSILTKTIKYYHVKIGIRWDVSSTRFVFSSDEQYVAVTLEEPNGTTLQIASLNDSPPVNIYQSINRHNWAQVMVWSNDSSQLFYFIAENGPVKLVQHNGAELHTLPLSSDFVSYSECKKYLSDQETFYTLKKLVANNAHTYAD